MRYCLFLTAVCLLFSSWARSETLVLEAFTLIDGTGRPPLNNAALVITDGKIVYAGSRA